MAEIFFSFNFLCDKNKIPSVMCNHVQFIINFNFSLWKRTSKHVSQYENIYSINSLDSMNRLLESNKISSRFVEIKKFQRSSWHTSIEGSGVRNIFLSFIEAGKTIDLKEKQDVIKNRFYFFYALSQSN